MADPVKVVLESWDPDYGSGNAMGEMAAPPPADQVDVDLEVPAGQWTPIEPRAAATPSDDVVFIDGVQRVDARMFTTPTHDDFEQPAPGLLASYAAGAVRCTLTGASYDAVAVDRAVIGQDGVPEIACNDRIIYRPVTVPEATPPNLSSALISRMRGLERTLAATIDPADLLILDGPLTGSAHIPGAVGFIKTHHRLYLPDEQQRVVAALPPATRSPLFATQGDYSKFAWYLKLPTDSALPMAGIVRLEAAADISLDDAMMLADRTVASLPRFASKPHRDSRAPQNLTPIGGLEAKLRHQLGDRTLLERMVRRQLATF